MSNQLTPDLLIRAYSVGLFPMAESHDDPTLYWIDPEWRGILPLDGFHVPRSLRKAVRKLTGAKKWSPRCQKLNDQIVEYLRHIVSQHKQEAKLTLMIV